MDKLDLIKSQQCSCLHALHQLSGHGSYALWVKYTVYVEVLRTYTIADKRYMFSLMRHYDTQDGADHLYVPKYGITLGQFALMHLLMESHKRTAPPAAMHTRSKRPRR